jgi:hypothetical protein
MRHGRHLLIAAALLGLGGCGGGTSSTPPPVDTTITVWNRAQSELVEVRVHGASESYAGAPNLLAGPLAVEARAEVALRSGQRVTVLRRKVELAEPSAFTTAEGIEIYEPGFALIVFDSSFRLMEPGSWE